MFAVFAVCAARTGGITNELEGHHDSGIKLSGACSEDEAGSISVANVADKSKDESVDADESNSVGTIGDESVDSVDDRSTTTMFMNSARASGSDTSSVATTRSRNRRGEVGGSPTSIHVVGPSVVTLREGSRVFRFCLTCDMRI